MARSGFLNSAIVPFVTLLLGGGVALSILNLVRARTEARKAPVDRDAIIVTSAESAVVIMKKVLDTTSTKLESTSMLLDMREKELHDLQDRVSRLQQELAEVRKRCEELEELINMIADIKREDQEPSSRG